MPDEPTRLLKANAIRGLGSKIVFNYEDLRERCNAYVEKVRHETRNMIQNTQIESDSIRKEAYEQGRQSGFQQGLRDAEEQIRSRAEELADQLAVEKLKTTLPAMQAATDLLVLEREKWMAAWEKISVQLSLAVAEKVLRRKLNVDPKISTEMIRGVLELATGTPHITLKMNPEDLEHLGDHAEDVIRSMASCGKVTLIADESISSGGCVIETQHGVINAEIENQLERIASELLE
jgi:flagellar assembly protein FliH